MWYASFSLLWQNNWDNQFTGKERFFWVHGIEDFGSWPAVPLFWKLLRGSVVWRESMPGGTGHLVVAEKQKRESKKSQGPSILENRPLWPNRMPLGLIPKDLPSLQSCPPELGIIPFNTWAWNTYLNCSTWHHSLHFLRRVEMRAEMHFSGYSACLACTASGVQSSAPHTSQMRWELRTSRALDPALKTVNK